MAQVRIEQVLYNADGTLTVSATLPDGTFVRDAVIPVTLDRHQLALAVCQQPSARSIPQLTGFEEISDAEYSLARSTSIPASAPASAPAQPAPAAPASEPPAPSAAPRGRAR